MNCEGWLRRALAAKRDGEILDDATWRRIVEGYVAGTIDDAPIAALAMACAIRGMGDAEVAALTGAMVRSGDVLAYPHAAGIVVDKHSSGGVGDTVSLVAVPLVAACGVPVAKLSGRALGHTGGTLDKLEAIPGVRTDLSPEAFVAQVETIGCAIAAQSDRLVPADRKLYALRDRTGTVPSPGLIAASIVSKKIAGGAGAIVFDVKAGRGAFMRTAAEAVGLARMLVQLAERFGRRASALVSDMDEPLGAAVGSGIEAVEARDFLRGDDRDPRLAEAIFAVVHEMLRVAGVPGERVVPAALDALESGAAYARFVQMIEAQGGTRDAVERIAAHPARSSALAPCDGVVTAIDAIAIGELARELTVADGPFSGIRIVARTGTPVRAGDVLAECAGTSVEPAAVAQAFTIGATAPPPRPLVDAIVRDAAASEPSKARS
ncbi:pyrimidine-nucleoside phosphorylase [Vulcanimicrobium alpinum]|uniref:Pyrimidine-nucleoside phosphorylase n=1 Tax=Vulcanimicrobium alpinum TaxID=3016050 RepID=A0AAN1XZL4_UNVUL|nr:thymidine phosphorylase [Vulcanimicrobium alpinum]BDE07686.1 pyrimidine-nucleoside phosphorylase [Vulcanimicrobium alpinum]